MKQLKKILKKLNTDFHVANKSLIKVKLFLMLRLNYEIVITEFLKLKQLSKLIGYFLKITKKKLEEFNASYVMHNQKWKLL